MMRADLHAHSVYSDGHYTPDEVCRRARFAGVEVISITDHDTMNGLEEKRAAAQKYGLLYVDGWEISAYDCEEKIHVLGYGCRCGEAYERFMRARVEAAMARAEERVKKLNGLGISVTMDEVLALQADKDSPLHTMHVARALAKHLGVSEGEAYGRYLGKGGAAESTIGRPTPYEAIECIHACGGIAFLAHPGRINLSPEAQIGLVKDLSSRGLDGIECYYSTHTPSQTEFYLRLAAENRLLISGGSDTHWEEGGARSIGSPVFHLSEGLFKKLQTRE